MKLILLGGFLGSGKTTAIQQAAEEYMRNGTSVGVITNDQGAHLVDSQYLKSFKVPVREVTDGCFCCNFHDLEESIHSLDEECRPQVIFAESVGSCTDLISTVVNPVQRYYPNVDVIITVFADARILPVLIQESSNVFDEKVHYIYRKQLEEADILVINKVDLISDDELRNIKQIVENKFSRKKILYLNSLNREDIKKWIMLHYNFPNSPKRKSLEVDYNVYGNGEAFLGWLDSEIVINTENYNAIKAGYELIKKIYEILKQEKLPVGHLKCLISDGVITEKVSFTCADEETISYKDDALKIDKVKILINARIQTEPEQLKDIFYKAINNNNLSRYCHVIVKKISVFKPGFPQPTYRIIT